jgi:hypothetical protein
MISVRTIAEVASRSGAVSAHAGAALLHNATVNVIVSICIQRVTRV